MKQSKDKGGKQMTTKEKQLLLKDLCARVPYVQFVYVEQNEPGDDDEDEPNIHTLTSCNLYGECILDDGVYKMKDDVKPYLRPMSSMTEEEKNEHFGRTMTIDIVETSQQVIDWLLKHHFDYHGLIEKGLALEAPENMYREGNK